MYSERLESLELWLQVDVELAEVEDPLDQTWTRGGRGMVRRGDEVQQWICMQIDFVEYCSEDSRVQSLRESGQIFQKTERWKKRQGKIARWYQKESDLERKRA